MNRTRKPSPELRAWAAQLVAHFGVAEAARIMGRARLTVLSLALGGDMYGATLEKCEAKRNQLKSLHSIA